jgi:general secretion pathway protein G
MMPMMTERRMRKTHMVARGFTLVELLLVLVILAVLAMVVVPKFTGRSEQARQTAARSDVTNIATALDSFEVDCGRYPASLDELMRQPANAQNWHGPYLNKLPIDPWGNPYVYRYPGTRSPVGYDLFSMGQDGREGNDDIAN